MFGQILSVAREDEIVNPCDGFGRRDLAELGRRRVISDTSMLSMLGLIQCKEVLELLLNMEGNKVLV